MTIKGTGQHVFSGTYEEVIEPEKIVYSANLGPATIRVTIQFFEQGEQIAGTGPPRSIIGDSMRRLFPSLTMDSGQTIYWNLISRMQTS